MNATTADQICLHCQRPVSTAHLRVLALYLCVMDCALKHQACYVFVTKTTLGSARGQFLLLQCLLRSSILLFEAVLELCSSADGLLAVLGRFVLNMQGRSPYTCFVQCKQFLQVSIWGRGMVMRLKMLNSNESSSPELWLRSTFAKRSRCVCCWFLGSDLIVNTVCIMHITFSGSIHLQIETVIFCTCSGKLVSG